MKKDFAEEAALSYLPQKLSEAVRRASALYNGGISEIRIRTDCPVFMTVGERNISCGVTATAEDTERTVRSLCGNSLYSHSETIKEGYICVAGGIRAGVCGRAVTENGRIISVTDITSVAVRIPHRVVGAGDDICRLILEEGGGILVYSSPGVGKTTALREVTARLSGKPYYMRIAVVDTRFEICGALGGSLTFDALSGYPRAKGIETALRTLSPQLIVCDEIGSKEDAEALYDCMGAGVPVAASVHAGSYEELMQKPYMSELLTGGVFKWAVGLKREGGSLRCTPVKCSPEKALC